MWSETRLRLIEHGIDPEWLPEEWEPEINLGGADLGKAYLGGAYLGKANLIGAYLGKADLRGANLGKAYLGYANLSEADLRGANLTGANLRGANLTGANLQCVNLYGATLTGAEGNFATGSFGRHTAVAAGGYISVGCERHTYDHWLEHYAEIGKANGYTDAEIARYGVWIQTVVEWLREVEETDVE